MLKALIDLEIRGKKIFFLHENDEPLGKEMKGYLA